MKHRSGLVVASFGRHVLVETSSGERVICHPRGKKSTAVVGDRVQWQPTQDEGTVEKLEPRRNLFYRQDEMRTKSFAANLDQVLILIAAEPEFSENQLSRALIAAEAEHIHPIIALNKNDLTEPFAKAWARLMPYRDMGYDLVSLALKPKEMTSDDLNHFKESNDQRLILNHNNPQETVGVNELTKLLQGKITLVLGPSGAGKSTLINTVVPLAHVLTQEISQALNSGKHTTTTTTWYWVDADKTTAVIDSPGFQEFGLNHIEAMHLASYMPDFKAHVPQCKFYNCSHLHEPGCGVIESIKNSQSAHKISLHRYKIYSDLFAELSEKRY